MESKETVAALRAAQQTGALLATERLALLSMGWQPPSARQVRCSVDPGIMPCVLRCKAHDVSPLRTGLQIHSLQGVSVPIQVVCWSASANTSVSFLMLQPSCILHAQVDDWRMRRVGRLKVCGGQLEHAKSLLAGSSKSRSPQMQALRKAARSLSELLRPGTRECSFAIPCVSISRNARQSMCRNNCTCGIVLGSFSLEHG